VWSSIVVVNNMIFVGYDSLRPSSRVISHSVTVIRIGGDVKCRRNTKQTDRQTIPAAAGGDKLMFLGVLLNESDNIVICYTSSEMRACDWSKSRHVAVNKSR